MDTQNNTKNVLLIGFGQSKNLIADAFNGLFKNAQFKPFLDEMQLGDAQDIIVMDTGYIGSITGGFNHVRNVYKLIRETQPDASILVRSCHNDEELALTDSEYTHIGSFETDKSEGVDSYGDNSRISQALIAQGLELSA